jgi:hypothetical protein
LQGLGSADRGAERDVCLVLAFCCNDWPEGEAEPAWLRRAEAGGCAAVVALGMGIMCSSGLLPIPSEYLTLRLVAIIVTLSWRR